MSDQSAWGQKMLQETLGIRVAVPAAQGPQEATVMRVGTEYLSVNGAPAVSMPCVWFSLPNTFGDEPGFGPAAYQPVPGWTPTIGTPCIVVFAGNGIGRPYVVGFPTAVLAADLPITGGTMTGPIAGFEDKGGQLYNVKAYGAKGNGSTDDTAAIQSAINAAGAAGGGIVFFPLGTYLVTSTLTVTAANISIAGINNWNNWGTASGTVISVGSGLTGSVISVSAGEFAIKGVAFTTQSGTNTALTLSLASVSQVTIENVFSTNLGGVSMTSVGRALLRSVCLQAWDDNGTTHAGFYLSGCTEVWFEFCNAAAAGTGTSTAWIANYYISGCESISFNRCESNNTPYYGICALNSADCQAWDLETNGAAASQVYIDGCTDWVFHRVYCLQPSVIPIDILNSSIIQFFGGWVESYAISTYVVQLDGTGGGTHDIVLSGVQLNCGSTLTSVINLTATQIYRVLVSGNIVVLGGAPAFLVDASSNNGRMIAIVGNILDATAVITVTGSLSGGGQVVAANNTGISDQTWGLSSGKGTQTIPVPATTVATGALPYACTFYITTTAAVSVTISGGPTITLPTTGVTTVRVPAGCTLTPTYSSTAPTWVVEGE